MKKTIKILIMATVLMLMFGAVNAFAADDIGVYVDGKAIEFDVAPQIISDRTMIPFRYVANAFDAEVDYKEEADGRKIVTAVQGDKTLKLTIGNTDAVLIENGKEEVISFDVAPLIVEGRTLVPVRLIGEAFGCSVGWDNANRDVIIIDVLSGVTSDYKAQCPEFFNEILSFDLNKIQGYYNVYLTAPEFDLENEGLTISFAKDDDAVMFSFSDGTEQVEVIATYDAFYISTPYTMGLWVKCPYNEFIPDFKISSEDLAINSDMILKAVADSMLMYDASLETFYAYSEGLAYIVEQAKAGNLKVEKKGDIKTVEYELIIPDNDVAAVIEIFKSYKKDTLSAAAISLIGLDQTTGETEEGFTLIIEREDAAEAFDIKVPSDNFTVDYSEFVTEY
ncbi:MAG: copper amine oxidase N-terminal domain-containing protein [Clostridia bacterium]|nr:copper amine oxidase N-terminal domain-containing protein [Clostridia bacterium]